MKHSPSGRHAITAARRGQIVQRVIVDGWTTARTAAAFDMPPRLVEIWVADYRRHGMTSLRRVPRRTVAVAIIELRLLRPAAALWRRMSSGWRRFSGRRRRAEPVSLRGSKDEGRGGGSC
jgi:transposase-like protein